MNGHADLTPMEEHVDIAIVGAGISGINASYRVKTQLPHLSYAVYEARDNIGGTWDLFKYPGIRSDSDLFTFGFSFNPWYKNNPIAEASSIKSYMQETVAKYRLDEGIKFRHRVNSAEWDTEEAAWTLQMDADGRRKTVKARFVVFGTGYYDYHKPLPADIPGIKNFKGQVIHPQFWPEDLDYTNKKVVIIGSGATAVTLLPEIGKKASQVTMLQRSPTYIMALPNSSPGRFFYWLFPSVIRHQLQRLSWILSSRLFFLFCQAYPNAAKFILRKRAERQLPKHVPHDPHFKPRYNPWDQRLCICPDGDFYTALQRGNADIKTDTIKTVTENGIDLNSGDHLDADIIVTATGLRIQIAGGCKITVDGQKFDTMADRFVWKGFMLSDVPNAAVVLGYTNASWTLGADATALLLCRLIKHLERRNAVGAVPRAPADLKPRPVLQLSSTYVTAAEPYIPRAGDRVPWLPRRSYLNDMWQYYFHSIDKDLELIKAPEGKFHMNGKA